MGGELLSSCLAALQLVSFDIEASCLDSCTFELPQEAPSLLEVLVHLAFCLVVNDAAYGYIHMQVGPC